MSAYPSYPPGSLLMRGWIWTFTHLHGIPKPIWSTASQPTDQPPTALGLCIQAAHLVQWWWEHPLFFCHLLCNMCSLGLPGTPSLNASIYIFCKGKFSFLWIPDAISKTSPLPQTLLAELPKPVPTFSRGKPQSPTSATALACPGDEYLAHHLRRNTNKKERIKPPVTCINLECSPHGFSIILFPHSPLGTTQGYDSACLPTTGLLPYLPGLIMEKFLSLH